MTKSAGAYNEPRYMHVRGMNDGGEPSRVGTALEVRRNQAIQTRRQGISSWILGDHARPGLGARLCFPMFRPGFGEEIE